MSQRPQFEDVKLAMFTDVLCWKFGPTLSGEPNERDVSECRKLAEFLAKRGWHREAHDAGETERVDAMTCLSCGSIYVVEAVEDGGLRRLWCSICGYWADRRKPDA